MKQSRRHLSAHARWNHNVSMRGLCMLGLLLAACSATTAPQRNGGSSSTGAGGTGVVPAQGACAPDNLTQGCTCSSANATPGRQTCSGGQWGTCECLVAVGSTAGTGSVAAVDGGAPSSTGPAADPPANSSANRFDWQRTPLSLGSCKAGHYIGNFTGFYGSPAAFTAPVPVASVDTPAADGGAIQPGLEFWLEKVPGSGELFKISGGKMRGSADGLFPFKADLTGTLDCSTKKYDGTIDNGIYNVFGTDYAFIGTMVSDYDKIQNKFISGQWKCTEPTSAFPTAGGSGMWDATWTSK